MDEQKIILFDSTNLPTYSQEMSTMSASSPSSVKPRRSQGKERKKSKGDEGKPTYRQTEKKDVMTRPQVQEGERQVKAIETRYAGCLFRSRLEARWAVFFDRLGIKWEYEKEGYDLDGVWYLPDFWLPKQKSFIEIKGKEPTSTEIEKIEALAAHALADVHIFYGEIELPVPGNFYKNIVSQYVFWDGSRPSVLPYLWGESGWAQCPVCLSLGITYHSRFNDLPCKCFKSLEQFMGQHQLALLVEHLPDFAAKEPQLKTANPNWDLVHQLEIKHWWREKCNALTYTGDSPRLIAAYTAARSARFEHK